MGRISLVVQGGAGEDSEYIRDNKKKYEEGISTALDKGYQILKNGGTAADAVEAAVNPLEDNPIFNAGRGSAINAKGYVEMCAAIMDGNTSNSGAVAIVQHVKNPVSLAKSIMKNSSYRFLGGHGALDYAKKNNIALETDSYFITEHQYKVYRKKREDAFMDTKNPALAEINEKYHGTVGAVAIDQQGNLAAATSTGGKENSTEGRIGDSSIIGAGCFADQQIAISASGDGEFIIKNVIANSIRCAAEYKGLDVQEACDYIIFNENKNTKGDTGVIALDLHGNVGIAFNCDRMPRGYKVDGEKKVVKIYK